jgi:cysteine desulfurase
MKPVIYLDNSATTPVLPEVIQAIQETFQSRYGNPSSLHRLGVEAEEWVREARNTVAKAIGAAPSELIFTGSGTEANNMAILGSARHYKNRGRHIISTSIEHACVLGPLRQLEREGFEVTYVKPDTNGVVRVEDIARSLRPDTILVSVMLVNNETGAIQPVQEIGALIKERPKTLFHVDAVQAFCKIPIDVNRLHVDYLTISGHKVYAPKGIGALYIRKQRQIQPLVFGGGQEGNLRSGTENVPGIVGLSAAVQHVLPHLGEYQQHMAVLRDRLWQGINERIPDATLHTPLASGLAAPHILYVSFPGVKAEVLLHALETDGIYVSTASACSSKDQKKSHVLQSMGRSAADMDSAIRFSFSPWIQEQEVDYVIDRLHHHVQELRSLMRR